MMAAALLQHRNYSMALLKTTVLMVNTWSMLANTLKLMPFDTHNDVHYVDVECYCNCH